MFDAGAIGREKIRHVQQIAEALLRLDLRTPAPTPVPPGRAGVRFIARARGEHLAGRRQFD